MKTRSMVLCALFAALIAVGAFLRIPLPGVPFTLQTLFVLAAGLLLGPRLGALSALLYLFIGLVGVPVFTEGGGLGYVLKPTFGYLLGFVAGAYIAGRIAHKGEPSMGRMMLACLAGMAAVYLLGLSHFYIISHLYLGTNIGLGRLFLYCFLVFVPGDVLCSLAACWLAKRLRPALGAGNKRETKTPG